MADVKISGLPAATSALTTQEFEVNEVGTSKKVTGQQLVDLVEANLGSIATQDSNSVTITGGSISGITDLAIADGGTGASTAQAARNNLLPSQTGNANKFLKSDGTNVSWDDTGVTDGDKGDITVSGTGTVWTIDSNAVTTTKIADNNVTTDKLSTTGVVAGAYGSATEIPVVTVDSKGRITNMATEALTVTGTLIGYQVFTSSSTYTKATNSPSFIIVEVIGGGGAGGGATANATAGGAGGGGGAGGYTIKKILASALAASETVTVGAGGTGVSGNTGNTGGTSSFGTFCSATGGVGGSAGSGAASGQSNAAGLGSGGDANFSGGIGSFGLSNVSTPRSGFGGSSRLSGGARVATGAGAGIAALANSGAGGSGGIGNTISSFAGGAGGSGIVIVWEYK